MPITSTVVFLQKNAWLLTLTGVQKTIYSFTSGFATERMQIRAGLLPNELETKGLVSRALWILELQKRVCGTESTNMRKYLQIDVLEVKRTNLRQQSRSSIHENTVETPARTPIEALFGNHALFQRWAWSRDATSHFPCSRRGAWSRWDASSALASRVSKHPVLTFPPHLPSPSETKSQHEQPRPSECSVFIPLRSAQK